MSGPSPKPARRNRLALTSLSRKGWRPAGHRGCFEAAEAERRLVGLFALVPTIVDAVKVPVVATGDIADERGVAAALMLGASAAQAGTAFRVCPEAKIHPAWAKALTIAAPEDTMAGRVFSGRAGRSLETDYVRAATAADAPAPAPYPVQRGLTTAMRAETQEAGDLQRMQVWAGQSAGSPESNRRHKLCEGCGRECRKRCKAKNLDQLRAGTQRAKGVLVGQRGEAHSTRRCSVFGSRQCSDAAVKCYQFSFAIHSETQQVSVGDLLVTMKPAGKPFSDLGEGQVEWPELMI